MIKRQWKAIAGRRGPIGTGVQPAIVASIQASSPQAVRDAAAELGRAGVDLIEWRIDSFSMAHDVSAVLEVMAQEELAMAGAPVLCTFRSAAEGGASDASSETILAVLRALADQGIADILDVELRYPATETAALITAAHRHGIPVMLSQHDFESTPSLEKLVATFVVGRQRGGDVVKVAVMPQTPDDVDRLLEATRRASEGGRHAVVGIAMGELGARSRIEGGEHGSVLTFAAGRRSSAPGQWPIATLRAALDERYGHQA
ncbi:MAG: type I 3-dehydroquinate dehydratase [Steroidobacteraceae bacterium]